MTPDVRAWVARTLDSHLRVAPLTPDMALDAAFLPDAAPGDPADRLLVATAREMGAALVTCDAAILAFGAVGHVRGGRGDVTMGPSSLTALARARRSPIR